jgi:YfiH family protein
VHGRGVQVWRQGDPPSDPADRPEADAQISNDPAHVLAVQVADCVPLLMADARRGAAAAVHAGWRGTAARIVEATIDALAREFDTKPEDLLVAIGPAIGQCCYLVGDELVEAFRRAGATADEVTRWFHRDAGRRLRLDLWTANRDQLVGRGVPGSRIFVAGLCTQTHPTVFDSFRAEGERAGRMAALIRVPAVPSRV